MVETENNKNSLDKNTKKKDKLDLKEELRRYNEMIGTI